MNEEIHSNLVKPSDSALAAAAVIGAARDFSIAFRFCDMSDEAEVRELDNLNRQLQVALEVYDKT